MEPAPRAPTTSGPPERFTGRARVDAIPQPDAAAPRGAVVRFATGARSAGHVHAQGRTLRNPEGAALIDTRDGRVSRARPSDTVYTPPAEWRSLGVEADALMSHLALSEPPPPVVDSDVDRGDHVPDDEYRAAHTTTERQIP